jgi:hypothetical protein
MKRLVATTILGLATSLSCFAQGNFTFNNAAASAVWDNVTTPGTPFKAGATLEVAVLWSGGTNAPSNYKNGQGTSFVGSPDPANSWAGILTDPNYQLGRETTGGNPVIVNTAGGGGPSAGVFLGGLHYLQGSSVGESVLIYVIAWQKSFGIDPVAAAAAGAPVGFSAPISFVLGSAASPGGSLANAGLGQFGVAAVPEPTTFALLGLGAAGLLIFRRRK